MSDSEDVRPQRTIARPAEVQGVGLHSGQTTTVRVKPAPPDTGVVFVRTDVPGYARIPALISKRTEVPLRTALANEGQQVHTIEHLLSAVVGMGYDNLEVEVDGIELPGMDGSAQAFVQLLREAGVHEQDEPAREIVVREPIHISHDGASLVALPYDGLRITYTLDYPDPTVPSMHYSCEVTEERYAKDIAPARTFVLKREAEALLAAGFGKGASLENTVVIGEHGPEGDLRFADEPVRHKILDVIGDCALLGAPLCGEVEVVRGGHALLCEVLRAALARGAVTSLSSHPG